MKTTAIIKPIDFALPNTLVTLGLASAKSGLSKSQKNPGMPIHNLRLEIIGPDEVTVPEPSTGAPRVVRLAGKTVQVILCENDGEEWGSARIVELFQKAGIELPEELEPVNGVADLLRQLPAMDAIIRSKPQMAIGPDGKPIISSTTKKPVIMGYELDVESFVEGRPDVDWTQPPY